MDGTLDMIARAADPAVRAAEHQERIEGFAERAASAWYSPAGRWAAAAMVFVVVMTGLCLGVFALARLLALKAVMG